MSIGACFRLSRFHKPAGTLLLWAPTAWALWLANQGHPPLKLVLLFLAGTILMRAAGCVINDLADRNIDKHVQRTRERPLTTGETGLTEAFFLLFFYLVLSLIVLLQLPATCFYYALAALFVTVLYPFCKRFFAAPQLILGLAFSMGIPMAYVASYTSFDMSILNLLVINFLWILAYDTQYAMADRADDVLIGVKSTAILLGRYDVLVIALLQYIIQILWLALAINHHANALFYAGWLLATSLLVYQQKLIATRDARLCMQAFNSNSWYGLLMWFCVMTGL